MLELASEHRVILASHAATFLGTSSAAAAKRLRALSAAGYITTSRLFTGQPACYQITRRGLEAIGSALPRPHVDLRAYAHDVGLAWLWLAARDGTFGPLREVLSERTLRSRDGLPRADRQEAGAEQPLGVRLGGRGAGGRERLHYPDLLLVTPEGRRVAVELELSPKSQARRERILAGFGSDPRIDAVLYLVDRPALAASIRSSARRLGISELVHVQWVRQSASAGLTQAPELTRTRAREGTRAPASGRS
jgi:DNA-binding MarR family transcriptional regulator